LAANLNLEATIVSGGRIFPGWESIEVSREHNALWATMKFRAAESTDGGNIPQGALSLDVGDQADGYLCGQKVISGFVMTRQVAADKGTHAVEIIVAAIPQSLDAGTVQGKPGQYINQTVQQIATSAAGLANVKVRLIGELSGTEIPFKRISEHVGERLADFIGRLAGWRNLHMTDDATATFALCAASRAGSRSPRCERVATSKPSAWSRTTNTASILSSSRLSNPATIRSTEPTPVRTPSRSRTRTILVRSDPW
jgi:prophage tail gpP-like protein